MIMKITSIYHELLLFTGTSLTSKKFTDTEENSQGKKFSASEEPEILGSGYPKCERFLWHVLTGKNFLYIHIGPNPVKTENDTSIDPYFFMTNACEN
jgi:hypothetical protein